MSVSSGEHSTYSQTRVIERAKWQKTPSQSQPVLFPALLRETQMLNILEK
jgi:hypothetical protein